MRNKLSNSEMNYQSLKIFQRQIMPLQFEKGLTADDLRDKISQAMCSSIQFIQKAIETNRIT